MEHTPDVRAFPFLTSGEEVPVGSEITRAGDADRERYISHLNGLYASGYIDDQELEDMRTQILAARGLPGLDNLMAGFPLPAPPKRPRDWGIPRNFIPVCTGTGVLGLLTAVLPSQALLGQHGLAANLLTSFTVIVGVVAVIVSVITMAAASLMWDESESEKHARRRRDRRGW